MENQIILKRRSRALFQEFDDGEHRNETGVPQLPSASWPQYAGEQRGWLPDPVLPSHGVSEGPSKPPDRVHARFRQFLEREYG